MPVHALLPAVNRLLQQVEEVRGLAGGGGGAERPEHPAAGHAPAPGARDHLPECDVASSYHVAFEAALLLRIVQLPAEERVNFTEKRAAWEKVVAQVEKLFKGLLGLAKARDAELRFYDGLMVQLRWMGPGLWAVRWLFEQAPLLRGLQAAVLQSQVQQNIPFLNAEVDKMSPADVVKASRAMNAAYDFQTAELLGLPPLAVPYQAASFEALARQLIPITPAEPATADPDREIVDGWAGVLGLSRRYCWKTP